MTGEYDKLMAIAAAQASAFGRWQASACGFTRAAVRWQVRQGRWLAVTRDVFVVAGSDDTWERRAWIALLDTGAGAVLSHRTAATKHAVPGFATDGIEVVKLEPRDRRTAVATVHSTTYLPADHVVVIDGLPCTSLARTIFDLAALSSPKRLHAGRPYVHPKRVARALDNATSRLGLGIDDVAQVVATLGRRGRDGTTLMRQLVDERSDGARATESELEDLFRSVLDAYGIPQPERQVVLGGTSLIGRVDFLFRAHGVVVEADGRKHHSALLDMERDRWRDLTLMAEGLLPIRVTWWDLVHRPDEFIAALRRILEIRAQAAA